MIDKEDQEMAVVKDNAVFKGHCERCHRELIVYDSEQPFEADDDNNFETDAYCPACRHTTHFTEDKSVCRACEAVAAVRQRQDEALDLERRRVVALERIAAGGGSSILGGATTEHTEACRYCGSPRSPNARFCPHCRLDAFGRAADAGAWNFRVGG